MNINIGYLWWNIICYLIICLLSKVTFYILQFFSLIYMFILIVSGPVCVISSPIVYNMLLRQIQHCRLENEAF